MGWLWSTPAVAPTPERHLPQPSETTPEPSATSFKEPSKSLSRNELADQEIQSFLQEIEADTNPSSTKYNRVSKQPPPSNYSSSGNGPLSEQLLPKTMSCRDAFDAAFYCNSMGGQFNNLYRYGTVRSCSENWNDFWFCMRTRGYGEKQKEEAIRARYRDKEKIRYGREGKDNVESDDIGRSSEDIWKSRDKKVAFGEVFNKPFPLQLQGSDAEWNNLERERRRRLVDWDGTMGS